MDVWTVAVHIIYAVLDCIYVLITLYVWTLTVRIEHNLVPEGIL